MERGRRGGDGATEEGQMKVAERVFYSVSQRRSGRLHRRSTRLGVGRRPPQTTAHGRRGGGGVTEAAQMKVAKRVFYSLARRQPTGPRRRSRRLGCWSVTTIDDGMFPKRRRRGDGGGTDEGDRESILLSRSKSADGALPAVKEVRSWSATTTDHAKGSEGWRRGDGGRADEGGLELYLNSLLDSGRRDVDDSRDGWYLVSDGRRRWYEVSGGDDGCRRRDERGGREVYLGSFEPLLDAGRQSSMAIEVVGDHRS